MELYPGILREMLVIVGEIIQDLVNPGLEVKYDETRIYCKY